jgi:hypothetical protein
MTTPEMTELAERGRAFREEVFTDDFLNQVGEHLLRLSPAIIGQYALTEQFHVTHSSQAERVQLDGLLPGTTLLDPADEEFFRRQYEEQQLRVRVYSDDRIVDKYIIGNHDGQARPVYTSGILDDGQMRDYAVPERTKFLLRNLKALSTYPEVNVDVQTHADVLLDKYQERFVIDGKVEADAFRVDPRSPQLARALIGATNFAGFDDDFCVSALRQAQQDPMLEHPAGIPAKYLSLERHASFDAREYFNQTLSSGQVVFRMPQGQRLPNNWS